VSKILIVAYHFPPDASVGALRPAKFAKYLPEFGWAPIVLTVKEHLYPATDPSRSKDAASIRDICRTRVLPQASALYVQMKAWLGRRRARNGAATSSRPRPHPASRRSGLRRFVLSLEWLPDEKQMWIPMAIWHGLRLVRRHAIDATFTSGPPMSCHVVGLALKLLTGLPWIADFRDPWLAHREGTLVPSTTFSKTVEAWLENATLKTADKVVVTTERLQTNLRERCPAAAGKIEVIPNGYDPSDFILPPSVENPSREARRFTLTHAGTIYYHRSPDAFLRSLSDLVCRGQLPRDRVRVRFLGESPGVRERCAELGLGDIVTAEGTVSYERCIEALYGSDVLVLFAQGQPLQVPGKFYDYVAVGKPILVIADDGATTDIAKRLNRATVVVPDDASRLEAHLADMFRRFERGTLGHEHHSSAGIQRALTRLEQTRTLAALLDAAVAARSTSQPVAVVRP